jgi:predicted esterase YcpF (UPF0227 family)
MAGGHLMQTSPHPHPKHRAVEMTDAEAGDLLRQLVRLELDIQKHLAQVAEKRRQKDALLYHAGVGLGGPFSTETCSLCGFQHTGSC